VLAVAVVRVALAVARPLVGVDVDVVLGLRRVEADLLDKEAAAGKKDLAEKAFQKACQLGKKEPEPWLALVAFLAGIDRKDDARKAIDNAKDAIKGDRKDLVLANCYAAIGDAKKAEELFDAALTAHGADRAVLRNVAGYYVLTGQGPKAESHLRTLKRLLESGADAPPEELAWLRGALAGVLASEANQAKFKEALDLVQANLKTNPDSLPDLRVKALLLASRVMERKAAIQLWEELDKRQPLAANERYTLFQLYEADDQWDKARLTMLGLLDSPEGRKDATLRARYARRLIRRGGLGDLREAEEQLTALTDVKDTQEAKANAQFAREIEARLLHAGDRAQEAVKKVKEYADAQEVDTGAAALLLDEFSQQKGDAQKMYREEAEQLYKKYAKESKSLGRHLVLAEFYARQGAIDKALDMCDEADKGDKAPPEAVANTMVATLRLGQPKPEHYRRVEDWFMKTEPKNRDSVALLISWADLHDLKGDYGKAEDLYREVLRKNDKNVVAINNLAWLLALKEGNGENKGGNGDKALVLLKQATDLVGDTPELLDTRGAIYVTVGKSDEAIKDLEKCVALAPSGTRYFHLAQAQRLAGLDDQAGKAWKDAKKSGLQVKDLHPLERPAYVKLAAELQ
jgi:tetratricopeptide (TPR) repeat protein